MTTATVPIKNISNWVKSGTAVTATSASDVARQAGLDWSVSLHNLSASYTIPGLGQPISLPLDNKFGVVKTTPFGDVKAIGVVGKRYQVIQNSEIFSMLDTLIDSGEAQYAAAGEYHDGAKVWMLLQLPYEVSVANDPHTAFILAKTSHDGSSSVVIKPVIERLFCRNQINKIFNNKNDFTYTLTHSTNSKLRVEDVRQILQLSYHQVEQYVNVANKLIDVKVSRDNALAYFKRIFPLPTKIENSPLEMLSRGEKAQLSRATKARATALGIFENSPTQQNISGTAFALWQSVIEYADHHTNERQPGVRALTGASDGLKANALVQANLIG